jgi:hypothetical protein
LINQQHQKIKIIITNLYLNNTLYKYNISNNIYKINNKIIFCFSFLTYFILTGKVKIKSMIIETVMNIIKHRMLDIV